MGFLKWLYLDCKQKYGLYKLQKKWNKANKHNYTRIGRYHFETSLVDVGIGSYGTLNVLSYGNSKEGLSIGHFCSIATDTVFVLSGEHNYNLLSTFPFKKVLYNSENESMCKGRIVLGDDVWIGYGSIILSGVHIGQGAVVGAGSVITKDIPPYAIYAGGRIIKYRFEADIIDAIIKRNIVSKIATLREKEKIDSCFLDALYLKVDLESVNRLCDYIDRLLENV